MMISGPATGNAFTPATRPRPIRLAETPSAHGASSSLPPAIAHALAFSLLGIGQDKTNDGLAAFLRLSGGNSRAITLSADDYLQFARLDADYRSAVHRIKANRPGITTGNAHHDARVHAITENRELFPPWGFSIRSELEGGASAETRIPPRHQPRITTVSLDFSISAIDFNANAEGAQTVTTRQVQASYSEWSAA